MRRRSVGQLGFADSAVSGVARKGRDRLGEIEAFLDWAPFERLLSEVHAARNGAPAYPPLVMFKVVLLQRWYDLSDPGMEEALADRLSFRAFAGFSLEDETPDHATIFRFRQQLERGELMERLLGELTRQLDARGLILRTGTLIDASISESAARRPAHGPDKPKTSETDPDARFGTNNTRGRYAFGYKLHAAVDAGSGLVRAMRLTPANRQEIDLATALVQGDEDAVYADRGYDGARLHDHLARHGIADGVLRRGRRGQPLGEAETRRNHRLSLKRRPVEKVFGTLKRTYGFARMRYFTQARNEVALGLACFAYNLKRGVALAAP